MHTCSLIITYNNTYHIPSLQILSGLTNDPIICQTTEEFLPRKSEASQIENCSEEEFLPRKSEASQIENCSGKML